MVGLMAKDKNVVTSEVVMVAEIVKMAAPKEVVASQVEVMVVAKEKVVMGMSVSKVAEMQGEA